MISKVIEALAVFTTSVISSMGYGGIVLLMAIESACIPLPSEIIMPFAGYLVYRGEMTLHGAALAGAIGCVVGSIPAYYLGQFGGRPLIEKYGRYVLLSHKELDLADRLFQRWGQWVVFAGRLLPVIRTFIAFPAGVSRMPMGKFVLYTFVGSYPWCYALAWVGEWAGEAWHTDPRVKAIYHRFELVIVVAGVLAVAWFVWHKVKEARRARVPAAADEG
ncbi:SNARE associated Golgi protein [Anaeromyxobacter sp. K]|uniref:SNARE associated Golgi protein n=1 Tax=Anaeromyxobacter dehalogenans (strain ATCC BAA-258 / DSM 21875 / 2CP-1) TaxID=455488 RepID=B8JH46_ANAD2|nr:MULTISPECIES: DedA family protein [Anaeromyxobacter]ACG72535.1 SNARE associated Golgi protein [Anaeromyxobacter sp. K]ACL64748.1 SNARE associated Golgi protein [Anaeromyxobacter dehalogenans 2CP-1]